MNQPNAEAKNRAVAGVVTAVLEYSRLAQDYSQPTDVLQTWQAMKRDAMHLLMKLNPEVADLNVGESVGEYTRLQVEYAFELVKPAGTWKDPIKAIVIQGAWLDVIRYAVEFYTATKAVVRKNPAGFWTVTADGYTMGPAGDH